MAGALARAGNEGTTVTNTMIDRIVSAKGDVQSAGKVVSLELEPQRVKAFVDDMIARAVSIKEMVNEEVDAAAMQLPPDMRDGPMVLGLHVSYADLMSHFGVPLATAQREVAAGSFKGVFDQLAGALRKAEVGFAADVAVMPDLHRSFAKPGDVTAAMFSVRYW
jgi:hypothetical protein